VSMRNEGENRSRPGRSRGNLEGHSGASIGDALTSSSSGPGRNGGWCWCWCWWVSAWLGWGRSRCRCRCRVDRLEEIDDGRFDVQVFGTSELFTRDGIATVGECGCPKESGSLKPSYNANARRSSDFRSDCSDY
jgi:hypothetical protein